MESVLRLTTCKGEHNIPRPVVVLNRAPAELVVALRSKAERAAFLGPIQERLKAIGYDPLNLTKALLVIGYREEWVDQANIVMEIPTAMRSQLDEAPSIRVRKQVLTNTLRETTRNPERTGGFFFRLKQA